MQLLRSFVDKSWVSSIDEDSVEYINKSFILQDFKGKEDIEKLAPMEKPAVSGNTLDSVDDMDSRNTPETLALETLANEAIKQIKNKEYYKVFEGEGFKDILLMGIGHHRKQCAVKTEYFEIPKKR
jgi:hypothetical protein